MDKCPHGGDIANNCADCISSIDHYYDKDSGLCLEQGYEYDRNTHKIIEK